jgi:ATP-dependent exoDNAse (exonuclease V) beta subunit
MAVPQIRYPHIMITKSSAGSGKTHHLSLRYLQSLLQREKPSEIRNILAITFTNKAVQEMSTRILDWMKRASLRLPLREGGLTVPQTLLETAALTDESTGIRQEMAFLSDLTQEEIVKALERNLERVLDHFNDFKVLTIDSFNTYVLKSLAYQLRLSPDFDIVIDEGPYVRAALEGLVEEVSTDAGVRSAFMDFIEATMEMDPVRLKWDPTELIRSLTDFIREKERERGCFIDAKGAEKDLEELGQEALLLANALLAQLSDENGYKPAKLFVDALKGSVKNGIFNPWKLESWIPKDFDSASSGQPLLKKGSAPASDEIVDLWNRIKKLTSEFVYCRALQRFSSVVRLYGLLQKRLEQVTSRDRVLPLNEFNRLLASVMQDDGAGLPKVPTGLYLYLAERYSHFLIDEFQDTNTLQWNNLEALVGNALSEGGSLFVVGDEKQSIYRWRGGNLELVNRILEGFRESRYPVESLYRLDLGMNYRSCEEIVSFNNRIFSIGNIRRVALSTLGTDQEIESFISHYENSQQAIHSRNSGKGFVYAELFAAQEDLVDRDGAEIEEAEDPFSEIRCRLLIQIKEVRQKYPYKDIAVLTGKNSQANEVVRWLLKEGIPVQSEVTVSLRTHPLVNELVLFLRFISDPLDNVSFLGFVMSEIFTQQSGLSRDAILSWAGTTLISNREKALYMAFREWQLALWEKEISGFFRISGYMPLYEYLVLVMRKWDIFSRFPTSAPYFLRLLEIVQSLSRTTTDNLADFLQLWDEKQPTDPVFLLKSAENLEAVRVMTIHKSKGLEFPVVFVPFVGFSKRMDNNFVEENAEGKWLRFFRINAKDAKLSMQLKRIYEGERAQRFVDELNDLYVALTRSRSALYLYVTETQTGKHIGRELIFGDSTESVITRGKLPEGRTQEMEENPPYVKVPFSRKKEDQDALGWFSLISTKVERVEEMGAIKETAKARGTVIHEILARITSSDPRTWESVLQKFCADAGLREDIGYYRDLLARNFSNREFAAFFDAHDFTARVEQDIVDEQGHLRRVDRFLVGKDEIWLVDFKTGQRDPKAHAEQLLEYSRLLKRIYPDHRQKIFLSYLDEAMVVPVSEDA